MALLKNELRKNYMKSLLQTTQRANVPVQSRAVCEKLLGSILGNKSLKNIGVYMSQDNEIDTMHLITELFKEKDRSIFLPVCTNTNITKQDNIMLFPAEHRNGGDEIPPRQHHLIFQQVSGIEEVEGLQAVGRFKIREPELEKSAADALLHPTIPHVKLDLVIVPAVILDKVTNMRIGYGKGYYDDFVKRFLYDNWRQRTNSMETLLAIELFKTWKEGEFKQLFSAEHNGDLSKFIAQYLKLKGEWEEANEGLWFAPLLIGVGLKEQVKSGEVLKEELHDWEMDFVVSG